MLSICNTFLILLNNFLKYDIIIMFMLYTLEFDEDEII
nr:MAG TPA: hypothetical protein [Caudoviricetes sp.]